MRALSFRNGLLFVALLLCTLTSHGPYVVMAGILLLCACCLNTADARELLFSQRYQAGIWIGASIIAAFYLWYLMVPHANTSRDLEASANNNFMFLILVLLFLAALAALIETRLDEVTSIVSGLLVLHSAALLLQTVVLLATNQYIDFIKPITGEASRYLNYQTVNPIFAYRPTGLYVEPSTFGAAVGALAVGYILLSRARGRTPSLLPIALTVVAMLTTQSAAAVVQTGALVAAVVITHKPQAKAWAAVALALLAIASPGLISAYLDSFMLKFNADSGMRFALVSYAFDFRRGWDFLFGYGPFSLEYDLYDLAARGNGSAAVASLNDSGLLNFFIVKFGIAGLAIPVAIFARMRKDIGTICLFCLLMTTKLSYTTPLLYIGLLPLVMRMRMRDSTFIATTPDALDDPQDTDADHFDEPAHTGPRAGDNPWLRSS
ncbi:hypothetical protein P3T18_001525 [Paraburkholderia sp. GAS199]|uniref:hypothetical protein n=1 Tax=Paraburkholderia sp. GAS199 TaxID=3035126 RepID=UPI003D23B7DF